ncbi:MAG: TonB family protein [Paludibacteraceae bacterium]|nr:TonB family protein [Paludibacteraceae bacterium]
MNKLKFLMATIMGCFCAIFILIGCIRKDGANNTDGSQISSQTGPVQIETVSVDSFGNEAISMFPRLTGTKSEEKNTDCIRMTNLFVNVEVHGKIAVTTFDMIFENSCERVMEGELEFPLGDGQTVSRYALDVNGKMREGVVVDKSKARRTFERIVRNGVDPGLVEKTKGNNFKTRIYPLRKGSPRHVIIGYEQEIKSSDGVELYNLPLFSEHQLDKFSLDVTFVNPSSTPKIQTSLLNLSSSSYSEGTRISFSAENVKLNDFVRVQVPVSNKQDLVTEDEGTNTFFYLSPNIQGKKDKVKPKSIAVVFDVSSSAKNRNIEKEYALLKDYLSYLGKVNVRLVTFSDRVYLDKIIPNATYNDIKQNMSTQPFDGGTQFGALNFAKYDVDEILLFSDGVSNFGVKNPTQSNVPLYAINSSMRSDYSFLSRLTTKGGSYINLNEMSQKEALNHLTHQYIRLISVSYDHSEMEDVYPKTGVEVDENLSIVGCMSAKSAVLKLNLGYGDKVEKTQEYTISSLSDNLGTNVKRIWAQKKVSELEQNSKENKDEIKELCMKYGLVSDYTSLIVLETVWDYIQYEIEPPAELREEYERIKKGGKPRIDRPDAPMPIVEEEFSTETFEEIELSQADTRSAYRVEQPLMLSAVEDQAVESEAYSVETDDAENDEDEIYTMVEKKAEFQGGMNALKEYLRCNLCYPEQAANLGLQGRVIVSFVVNTDSTISNVQIERGVDPLLDDEAIRVVSSMPKWIPGEQNGRKVRSYFRLPVLFKLSDAMTICNDSILVHRNDSTSVRRNNSTKMERRKRQTPQIVRNNLPSESFRKARTTIPSYLSELKRVPKSAMYDKYLKLRELDADNILFYIDVADYFYSEGLNSLAVRIISNLAELKMEEPEILRTLGGKLMEYGENSLALETYKDVEKVRNEEPQTYRDLAFAYRACGDYVKAYEMFEKVMEGNWDRFLGIKYIVQHEMDELVALHPTEFKNKKVKDERFGYDLRVVISWNTDNCDIDLWVTDPNKESCGYKHKKTYIGGSISEDFTRGYGPEEFLLKKAIKGTYSVNIHYYGTTSQKQLQPVIVKVSVFRNYGRKNQTCEEKMIVLDNVRGMVKLDEFEIK